MIDVQGSTQTIDKSKAASVVKRPCNSSKARDNMWGDELKAWFKERLCHSTPAEREAELGRTGALPCHREIILRTGADQDMDLEAAVCLVTQCSMDRLVQLQALMSTWNGEMSVAVFMDSAPGSEQALEGQQRILACCKRAAASCALAGQPAPALTVTIVYRLDEAEVRCPPYDCLYPVNTMRNVALAGARSDIVFLLDVDFVPSHGLCKRLSNVDAVRKLRQCLRGHSSSGPLCLVVPAFEVHNDDKDYRNEEHLRAGYEAGVASGFHVGHFPRGHSATDFKRWIEGPVANQSSSNLMQSLHGIDAYSIQYEDYFEPYVLALRYLVPAYDERFRGYGLNKISHLYEMRHFSSQDGTLHQTCKCDSVGGLGPAVLILQLCIYSNPKSDPEAVN